MNTEQDSKKNPLVVAFVALILIGSIYFFAGSIIMNIYIGLDIIINQDNYLKGASDFIEIIKLTFQKYRDPMLIIGSICQFFFFLYGTFYVFKKWHQGSIKEYFGFNRANFILIALSALGALFLLPIAEFLSSYVYRLFPILRKLAEISEVFVKTTGSFDLFLLIFTIGVTPAVCEEILFRGYFQRTLQENMAEPWHYILAGFVFALFHQRTLNLLSLFITGVYLGFIFYRSKSIYTSMTAHFTFNTTIILLYNFSFFKIFQNENQEFNAGTIVVSTLLFMVVCVLILLYSKNCFRQLE